MSMGLKAKSELVRPQRGEGGVRVRPFHIEGHDSQRPRGGGLAKATRAPGTGVRKQGRGLEVWAEPGQAGATCHVNSPTRGPLCQRNASD